MSTTAKLIVVLLSLIAVIGVVIVALILGSLSRKPAEAPVGGALGRIQARGELRVGMDTGNPPWIGSPPMYFLNQDGQPDGFDYQLALRVAKAAGVDKVKLVHHFYADFEEALRRDEDLDVIIGGYTRPPNKVAGIVWSESYLDFGLCLIVRTDSKIQTTADLVGKDIGVYEDPAAVNEVNHLVHGYKSLKQYQDGYLDLLATGSFDAFLYDYPFAVAELKTYYLQNPHRQGSLRIAQYNLTDSQYVVASREGDADLAPVINRAIAAWKEDGSYAAAISHYLSDTEITARPQTGSYTVVAGDTFTSIATRQLGSADRWKELWEANKTRYANPNLLEAGDHLDLPANAPPR